MRIDLSAYEDDDHSSVESKDASAERHMEIHLTIDGTKFLLLVGFDDDNAPMIYWDQGSFGGNGDPTRHYRGR